MEAGGQDCSSFLFVLKKKAGRGDQKDKRLHLKGLSHGNWWLIEKTRLEKTRPGKSGVLAHFEERGRRHFPRRVTSMEFNRRTEGEVIRKEKRLKNSQLLKSR